MPKGAPNRNSLKVVTYRQARIAQLGRRLGLCLSGIRGGKCEIPGPGESTAVRQSQLAQKKTLLADGATIVESAVSEKCSRTIGIAIVAVRPTSKASQLGCALWHPSRFSEALRADLHVAF